MRSLRWILAALLVLALLPAAADAASFGRGASYYTLTGGVLVGAAQTQDEGGRGRGVVVWAGRIDGTQAEVFRVPGGGLVATYALTGDGGRALFSWSGVPWGYYSVLIEAGKVTPLDGICAPDYPAVMAGNFLAYAAPDASGCPRENFVVKLMDLRTRQVADGPRIGPQLRAGGGLLGWRDPANRQTIVVYDPATRRVVNKPYVPDAYEWSIGEDGTIAAVVGGEKLVVWQPGRPPRTIASGYPMSGAVIARGVVVHHQQIGPKRSQYIATDLSGRRIQGFWFQDWRYGRALVFDGRRIAGPVGGSMRLADFPLAGERAVPDTAPGVTSLTIAPARFGIVGFDPQRKGRRRTRLGGRLKYRLERPGRTELLITRLRRGLPERKVGEVQIGRRSASGSYKLTGYLRGRRLRRGRYRATLTAYEYGLRQGATRSVVFTIAKP